MNREEYDKGGYASQGSPKFFGVEPGGLGAMGAPVKKVLRLKVVQGNDRDQTAEMFRQARDLFVCSEGVPRADRIGILELIKHEILTNMHNEIHGEY